MNLPICLTLVTSCYRSHVPGYAAVLPGSLHAVPRLRPCARCTQRLASSLQREPVNCPRPFKQHFIPPDDYKGKHRLALPNKHQEKNVLSEYMTACQLNSSYFINNMSFPPPIYLPHDLHAFFYSIQDVCMLSMAYALFLYQHNED